MKLLNKWWSLIYELLFKCLDINDHGLLYILNFILIIIEYQSESEGLPALKPTASSSDSESDRICHLFLLNSTPWSAEDFLFRLFLHYNRAFNINISN